MMRGSCADVYTPKVDGTLTLLPTPPVNPNWVWLGTLKNSARNSKYRLSSMWVFFISEKSRLFCPAYRIIPRPLLPNCTSGDSTKQEVSNQRSRLRTPPESLPSQTRLAPSAPPEVPERLPLCTTVKGKPLCTCQIPPTCQPSSSLPPKPWTLFRNARPCPNGRS